MALAFERVLRQLPSRMSYGKNELHHGLFSVNHTDQQTCKLRPSLHNPTRKISSKNPPHTQIFFKAPLHSATFHPFHPHIKPFFSGPFLLCPSFLLTLYLLPRQQPLTAFSVRHQLSLRLGNQTRSNHTTTTPQTHRHCRQPHQRTTLHSPPPLYFITPSSAPTTNTLHTQHTPRPACLRTRER